MSGPGASRRLLLLGGGGGLVGRAILREFSGDWQIRSLHRHPVAGESAAGVEWIPTDLGGAVDWARRLEGVDLVINVAWYRYGSARRFRPLVEGLRRCLRACEAVPHLRFLHISVPDAPATLETGLPYLACKREIDREVKESSLEYSIVRPSMLFGPRDRLLTVMLRLMRRYGRFPLFGDGEYHMSPLAAADLAAILRREAALPGSRSLVFGGPTRWRYRDLLDRMFAALGQPPRYVRLSPGLSVAVARMIQSLGSSLLYAYEVEWLLSDRLGPPPYGGLDRPLQSVEPFLDGEARRLKGEAP
ncbi:MAG: NAD(P)H-binding protein [Thermoplasmata archaeon]